MLARSLNARAIAHSRLAASTGSASIRQLSMATRPSAVALGKRPAVPRPSLLAVGAGPASVRFISFAKPGVPQDAHATPEVASAAAAAPVAPDAPSASAAAPSAPADTVLSTPVPSSDIPAGPVEPPLPPVQHLTSTAPDHQFHSDPTPLLPQPPANAMTPTLEDLITNSGLPLEEVLNSPEAIHAAVKVSDLKLMGLDHSVLNLAGWVRDALVGMHEISGLPWWGSIMALTLGLRMCMFPLILGNVKHSQRLAAVTPQMQGLMKRMTDYKKTGNQVGMQVTQKNLTDLFKEHDVSPFRPILMPLIQMPFFLGFFYALRGLVAAPLPQLKEGGFSWLTDLTVPDPWFILPITSVLCQLLVFKVGPDGSKMSASGSRNMAHMRNVFMCLTPVIALTISQFPAAVLFYWTTTNVFTLTQAFFLRQQWVRTLLRIPDPPKVEAPPEDAQVDTNPGIKGTYMAFKEWYAERMDAAMREGALRAAAKADVSHEKKQSMRPGTAQLAERISEPASINSRVVANASTFLEDKPAVEKPAPKQGVPLSREQIRAQRIEAARLKRKQDE